MKNLILRSLAVIATLSVAWVFDYFALPVWNWSSPGFWGYLISVLSIGVILFIVAENIGDSESFVAPAICGGALAILLAILTFISFGSWDLFHAKEYANLTTITDGVFEQDIPETTGNKNLPIVDRPVAIQLGKRSLGTMASYSSQYKVSEDYTPITSQGQVYRISPLEYAGFAQHRANKHKGIPGYVLVNMYTQETKLVETSKPIRVSKSAWWAYKLSRHMRNAFPHDILGTVYFQLDNTGHPYYVAPIETHTIGLFGGPVVKEVAIVDAYGEEVHKRISIDNINADSEYSWVDYVYSPNFILERLDWNQKYQLGWINMYGWFGTAKQINVKRTTALWAVKSPEPNIAGYNYVFLNGDIYLYTGITSNVESDETNYGFVLCNMRTLEIKYYNNDCVEESSIRTIAQNIDPADKYIASDPIPTNVDGNLTFFTVLKDGNNNIAKYAFVHKKEFSTLRCSDIRADLALNRYRKLVGSGVPVNTNHLEGIITELYTANREGGLTYFYFKFEDDPNLYMSSISNGNKQVTLKVGDKIAIDSVDSEEPKVLNVTAIKQSN